MLRHTFLGHLFQHRQLLINMSWREINGRYRGSMLGRSWTLLNPIIMLSVYTFVFSAVFKARWQDLEQLGPLGFAVNIFSGLIVFNFFAECANAAPGKILENSSFVKRVLFPLEILAAVTLNSALFHALSSLLALAAFDLAALHHIPATFLLIPVTWMPLILLCLGLAWLLQAGGVFFRDITQLMAPLINIMMFLSAVFYPISALPAVWQPVLRLNPLAATIEQTRLVAVQGVLPSQAFVVVGSLAGLIFCEISFRVFQKARRGFADVL